MTILREDLDETHQFVLYLRNTSQMLSITGISHFIIGTCIKLFMLTPLLLQLCQGLTQWSLLKTDDTSSDGCILDIAFIVGALYNGVVSGFHVSQPVESYCWVLRHGRYA